VTNIHRLLPFCQYCGKSQPDGASSCSNCGKPLVGALPGSQPTTNALGSLSTLTDLVMKKKILSLREHYDFEDRNGTKLGQAEGNFFQFPARFVVTDASGSEFMHVEGKVFSLRKQSTFYDSTGQELGTIKKKIVKLIGEEYWVEKDGAEFMRIYGSFTEHEYQMTVDGAQVALVHKRWFTVRDQIGVSITGPVDRRVAIGAVIVIEHVEVTEKESRS
jgi:uncharacterized protein YxjI